MNPIDASWLSYALSKIPIILDTPRTYVMLINRDPIRPRSVDEVSRDDGLFSATKKIFLADGIKGLTRGLVPQILVIAVSAALKSRLTRLLSHKSHRSSIVSKVIVSILTCIIVNPLSIIAIRLRLQSTSRSIRDELSYLWLRMSLSQWFTFDMILPNMLRHLFFVSIAQTEISTPISHLISESITMPLLRCHELSAATIKDLEEPIIPLARYQDFGHEIVLDSAWHGFTAQLEESVLSALLQGINVLYRP